MHILFRPCPPTHLCQQAVRVCLRLKWARMLSDCPSPYARKFVPVWMPPAHAAVTGECWLAGWTLTGNFACTKIICINISTRQMMRIIWSFSTSLPQVSELLCNQTQPHRCAARPVGGLSPGWRRPGLSGDGSWRNGQEWGLGCHDDGRRLLIGKSKSVKRGYICR